MIFNIYTVYILNKAPNEHSPLINWLMTSIKYPCNYLIIVIWVFLDRFINIRDHNIQITPQKH